MRPFSSFLLLTSLVCASPAPAAEPAVNYDGFKIIRIDTHGKPEITLEKLKPVQYSRWAFRPAHHIDISIAPDQVEKFNLLGLPHTIMHDDLGRSVITESQIVFNKMDSNAADNLTWFNSYHPWADHVTYLKNLRATFSSNSEMISSGTSYQGRDIYGIHLWGSSGPGKPAILWHGNVHAREWITSMTVEYLTYQLVTGFQAGDSTVKSILDKYDFFIFPIVNPDGFVYSQTNDRLWRKNRQPPPTGSCYGRDINRNWPHQWGTNPQGASTNPCDETYQGQSAGDTPEIKSLVAYVDKLRDSAGIKLYIDWHSYGQEIASPWGYTCADLPVDSTELVSLAEKTANAIKSVQGKIFATGPTCTLIYPTTGDSTDYIHGPGKSDYTYTIELRDEGNYGFVLPANQILPSGRETWEGIKAMLSSL